MYIFIAAEGVVSNINFIYNNSVQVNMLFITMLSG